MSLGLVAYGSSDEGEESEEETPSTSSQSQVGKTLAPANASTAAPSASNSVSSSYEALNKTGDEGPHISDEEDEFMSAASTGLKLPPPKESGNKAQQSDLPMDKSSSVLSALPAPKTASRTFQVEEGELEDMVKPKAAELTNIEKPPPKKRKVVKITVPSLGQYDSDDSDDDMPQKKVIVNNKGKSGLFALLPQPKNTISKETGRALIPHALSKKPKQPPKPAKKPVSAMQPRPPKYSIPAVSKGSKEDSDDDEEAPAGGFFSFGDDSSKPSLSTETEIKAPVPSLTGGPFNPYSSASVSAVKQDQPLQFNKADSSIAGVSHYDHSAGPSYTANHSSEATASYEYDDTYAYNQPYTGEMEQEPAAEYGSSLLPDEQLLRLQGKNKRGREEINIIDVNVDTKLAGTAIELTKGLTEESEIVSHSKKGKDLPSSQSKRKHQITYLAHKAKEREFELKNSWAENRLTKRQTQAKYGF